MTILSDPLTARQRRILAGDKIRSDDPSLQSDLEYLISLGLVARGAATFGGVARTHLGDAFLLTDTALLAEYHASEAEAGDGRLDALAAELDRRGLVG